MFERESVCERERERGGERERERNHSWNETNLQKQYFLDVTQCKFWTMQKTTRNMGTCSVKNNYF